MTFVEGMFRLLLMFWELVFGAVMFGAAVGALSMWVPQRFRRRREAVLRAGCPEWDEARETARSAREFAHMEELRQDLGPDTVPTFAPGVVKVGADQ